MNKQHIEAYAKIEQPPRDSFGFLEDIKKPLEYHFQEGNGCDAGQCAGCLSKGVALKMASKMVPETAMKSFARVLAAKNVAENSDGYPVCFRENGDYGHEEYELEVTPAQTTITANDCDGFRRAVYFLEDRICQAEGASVMPGKWHRQAIVKHRISRCFFGPTNRPPFFIDELMNDVDYYPEEYLNKLAHEGINGLWLTMYFKDLKSSIFPNRGKDAERRLAKLRLTVERCLKYGIRIYVFFSEPKYWGNDYFSVPFEDAKEHPETVGAIVEGGWGNFCLSTEAGQAYIRESVEQIFKAVPQLGGLINIMYGEDNGSCVDHILAKVPLPVKECPVCMQRECGDIYREVADIFTTAMHKYSPDAEFIGWFYAPGQRDGTDYMDRLLKVAAKWPEDATLMFNFESGGTSMQLGKKRVVLDYSLAYVGPSQLFAESTRLARRTGAKLQVGCSHEDASIPFIPVPENLYDKYKFIAEHGVSAVMQCWYFGNYPGMMNKAAGELSFGPFPCGNLEFLTALARPDWRSDAPQVAEAWHCFSMAYRQFPSNLTFEWYGPLHHCIAWPLHLFPVDEPISPSWLLKQFPEVSGDRIGECLSYYHTLDEGLQLCTAMSDTWQAGLKQMLKLRPHYANDPARLADIDLSEAVGLQMKSAVNVLKFYSLREDMLYNKHGHLDEMKAIVLDELANTRRMKELCERDSRLGYHSEAEGYLFFPQKLAARIVLLNELLDEDFPRFDLNATWVDEYNGSKPARPLAVMPRGGLSENYPLSADMSWCGGHDGSDLRLVIHNGAGKKMFVEIAPCRLWPSVSISLNEDGVAFVDSCWVDAPQVTVKAVGCDLELLFPIASFGDFNRPGFPWQFNIHGEGFAWIDPQLWPARLAFGTFNPNGTGWLKLED